MYKVFFEPTYEENKYLGEVSTADEALELICDYCVDHQYSPSISHWHKIDAPYREIIDVGTGHDYFSIINESGGRVIFETDRNKVYCNAPDCPYEDCDMHISHKIEGAKTCDVTLWCKDYIDSCFGEVVIEEESTNLTKEEHIILSILIFIALLTCAIPLILAIYLHNALWLTLYLIIAVVLIVTCKFFKVAKRGDFDDRI